VLSTDSGQLFVLIHPTVQQALITGPYLQVWTLRGGWSQPLQPPAIRNQPLTMLSVPSLTDTTELPHSITVLANTHWATYVYELVVHAVVSDSNHSVTYHVDWLLKVGSLVRACRFHICVGVCFCVRSQESPSPRSLPPLFS
jgi:hypothetical protein